MLYCCLFLSMASMRTTCGDVTFDIARWRILHLPAVRARKPGFMDMCEQVYVFVYARLGKKFSWDAHNRVVPGHTNHWNDPASEYETQLIKPAPSLPALIDWCCFYYFVRNSLVALLKVLCARIFSFRFVNIGFVSGFFFFVFVCARSLTKPFFRLSQPGSCAWLSPFLLCADCTCVLVCVCLCMCMWKCVGKVINI